MTRASRLSTVGALLFLVAAPGWGQRGLVRGVVLDAERNPIPGVKVTVTSGELSSFRDVLITDDKGEFKIRFLANQVQYRFDFLFEKPGFQSFSQPLSPSALEQRREEFVMEASAAREIERHGDLAAVVTGSTNLAVEAFNTGLTAQREGDLDTARRELEMAVAADELLVPAWIALGQVRLDQGEHPGALDAAERALALAPGGAEALRVKYQALRALGRDEEAAAAAAELDEAEDAVAAARRLYNEGGEAFQAGDHKTALARFRRAAELDPSLTDAHHAIATLELGAGSYQAAAAAAERALSLGSDDVRTLQVLYSAYEALGRSDELTEIAPRLAAVDPDFGGSKLVEQAAELWNSGESEKAVSLSRQALAIDPSLAKAHYFIGLDHLAKGENPKARAALERFIELAPEDPEAETAREMLAYIE